MKKKIIVVTGPTASGKTALAIKVAKKTNAQIICADSRIVYKDFDIVSAKPTPEEQEGIVHHLIDIMEPTAEFSAGDFVKRAQDIIDNTDDNIIIAGGSWFYIKSLLDNKALIKCSKNEELRKELEEYDSKTLWEKLHSLDKKRALEIHPNNKEKIIRSIEMCSELNCAVSEYIREDNSGYDAIWYMIDIDRATLYERINNRVDVMVNTGLYEEWQQNKEKYPNSKVLYNTIGYKEFFEYDYDTALEKIKQHTRNFAKRQLTFFNNSKNIKLIKDDRDIL